MITPLFPYFEADAGAEQMAWLNEQVGRAAQPEDEAEVDLLAGRRAQRMGERRRPARRRRPVVRDAHRLGRHQDLAGLARPPPRRAVTAPPSGRRVAVARVPPTLDPPPPCGDSRAIAAQSTQRTGSRADGADVEVGQPHGLARQLEVAEVGGQLAEHRPQLPPGQVGAEAEVRAVAEGEVEVRRARRGRAGTARGTGARPGWPTGTTARRCRPPDRRRRPARSPRVAVRANWMTGEVQRSSSSTAVSTMPSGSAASRCALGGCSSSACTPPVMALRVVSLPAAISRLR